MRFNPEGEPPKVLLVYGWDTSATGSWSVESGLHKLRDDAPEDLAEILWAWGIHVQNTAMYELIAHGNPRKAAEVARALVEAHPIVEKSIREGFGDEMAKYLLRTKLTTIPSCPAEFPRDIVVQYVQ